MTIAHYDTLIILLSVVVRVYLTTNCRTDARNDSHPPDLNNKIQRNSDRSFSSLTSLLRVSYGPEWWFIYNGPHETPIKYDQKWSLYDD